MITSGELASHQQISPWILNLVCHCNMVAAADLLFDWEVSTLEESMASDRPL